MTGGGALYFFRMFVMGWKELNSAPILVILRFFFLGQNLTINRRYLQLSFSRFLLEVIGQTGDIITQIFFSFVTNTP